MQNGWRGLVAGLTLATAMGAGVAHASELIINTDTSDPAPKAAMQWTIDEFEAENPDVNVS